MITKNIRTFVFVIAAFALLISGRADAAAIKVTNELDTKVSVTLTYIDADSGAPVTQGWWHVPAKGETEITVNADSSKSIYYAAYNKDQFVDSSTKNNEKIKRWANPRNFKYSTNAEPDDDDAWEGKFYKINGNTININSKPR